LTALSEAISYSKEEWVKPTEEQEFEMPVAIIDERGRIQLPRELRERLGLKPGDAVFYGEVDGEVRLKKADDPYKADYIGEALRRELMEGKTKTIQQYRAERGFDVGRK
jgi:AbrB family looped-hinge helix DNA binding protein